MKIRIPDLNGETVYIEDKKSIVLVGANGAGKTRMSVWIDENNQQISIHRISAQKSLNMPELVRPTEFSVATEKFLYGETNENKEWLKSQGKLNYRWGKSPEIHLLNDFDNLMELLMTEEYQKSIEYRESHKSGNSEFDNTTKLEQVKRIWENVIIHRKLKICAGKIEVINVESHDGEHDYNGSEMSDGERAIFYFIGEVLCAQENSLIIIDEPENHLHKSILVRLWDAIETARPDCTFLYVTHNLDFASSRVNTQIVWVKSMANNSIWNYEIIEDIRSTDRLLLEILGNRQKVLLVEGSPTKSIDRKLYTKLFPEYNIIPMESCNTVIQTTKAYNRIPDIHYAEVKGIIDRDRRSEEEISTYRASNIFVPNVAEIENLFLLPDVIRIVANKQSKENADQIISQMQDKVLDFLHENIRQQALLFTQQRCQNSIIQLINKKSDSIDEYKANLSTIANVSNAEEIFNQTISELQKIVDDSNFLLALKVINNKGLLPYTQLPNYFGWKKDYYIDYVLLLLNINDESGQALRNAIKSFIVID
ncbi:MAG TPA: DUF4435 domain-containing protein [Lachnospiraceae bacterium]|nr:DUF4435 domain-containing protein [Lachnospiraceae bacterium]